MLHTGDIYETRARQHRAEALRSLLHALSGFLFRSATAQPLSRTERCSRLAHGTRLTHSRETRWAA